MILRLEFTALADVIVALLTVPTPLERLQGAQFVAVAARCHVPGS